MLKEKISQAVEELRPQLLEAIQTLVKIESTKGEPEPGKPFGAGPDKALQTALTIGKELGFQTKNMDGYVGMIDFSEKERGLDILAHLDVVPAPAKEWTKCHPFEPIIENGKMYGRGTSDDKGPAMSSLFAMKAIQNLGIPLKKNVRLILGTDEESGSSDIAHYYATNPEAPATFSPDADFPVINVEKGHFRVTLASDFEQPEGAYIEKIQCGVRVNVIADQATAYVKGFTREDMGKVLEIAQEWSVETGLSLSLERGDALGLVVEGVGGHAAYPETANNAITGLLDLLTRLPFSNSAQQKQIKNLSNLFPHKDWLGKGIGVAREDKESSYLTLSLNVLEVSPTHIMAKFDSRTPISCTKENTYQVAQKNIEKAGFTLEEVDITPPHHVPANSPFVKTLLQAYETYTGQKGEPQITGGGTYVHDIANGVAFGASFPGTDNRIHGADEFIILDEIMLSTKIYAQVIVDLCGE